MERQPADVKAKLVEVVIERILPGGLGLAHAHDQTVMVPLAAPGDRLRVSIDRVKGKVAFAAIKEIVEPSALRVEPPCPYFGRCGGCDFQQLNYQAQLDAKLAIIKDCLRRIGGFESLPDFAITPSPNQWHYRSRAQWQYDPIRRRLGYFEAGSRRVCDVAECAVLAPELQGTLETLRARMRDGSLPDNLRDFRAIVGDEKVSLAPAVEGETEVDITRTIHDEVYRLNAESFFQTNAYLLPQLIDAVLADRSGDIAIELYCGVGLFTLPLARRFKQVIGVESNESAARFARKNLTNAGLANAHIENEDVADWLDLDSAGNNAARQRVDFLLVDPPRAGAESRVIADILKLKPSRICYVSCDPATLARDLKKLIAGGYTLDSLAAFDMFPQTHHVETVFQLSS